eukprot:CAMPEP_0174320474 /NCGR_PEP_ID=MMETSP0810-20121108/9578_1 /TAXON_ID=73025 ORGANISM="Eutreptiella gymnastica-like, Strain CCMP1594" /NCGR_SAMPLE_ID=MMETSP0810 /ASSEMBLY_ACC=CAM_ASM_000659 /LENGTH=48 /DNA_ID= /DNA_START= /DNA_END= /DNA_ORIENTATION=
MQATFVVWTSPERSEADTCLNGGKTTLKPPAVDGELTTVGQQPPALGL